MVSILSLSWSFNAIIFCISINSCLNENSAMRKAFGATRYEKDEKSDKGEGKRTELPKVRRKYFSRATRPVSRWASCEPCSTVLDTRCSSCGIPPDFLPPILYPPARTPLSPCIEPRRLPSLRFWTKKIGGHDYARLYSIYAISKVGIKRRTWFAASPIRVPFHPPGPCIRYWRPKAPRIPSWSFLLLNLRPVWDARSNRRDDVEDRRSCGDLWLKLRVVLSGAI